MIDLTEGPIMSKCPACGTEQEDYDGFGVLKCDCGWCAHASSTGGFNGTAIICDFCGEEINEPE